MPSPLKCPEYEKGLRLKLLKALNVLASFAEFSGVGRKTTMGFGKVKFFRKPENEK
jgi:CRISPR/Cas system endoribonuclease Cas6 (RAMP superfamily)